jgi:hypothetical protein
VSLVPLFSLLLTLLVLARHYAWTRRAHPEAPAPEDPGMGADDLPAQEVDILDRNEPTAVFLVGGRNDLGPHVLRVFSERCAQDYKQALFLAVGAVDASLTVPSLPPSERFERSSETKELRKLTRLALDPYVEAAHGIGLKADCRISIAANPAREIARQADGVVRCFPRTMFFIGKPVFEYARWYHCVLHSKSSDSIREILERRGIPVTVIPVVLAEDQMKVVGHH